MSEKTIGVIFLSSVLLPANKNNQELLEKNDLNLEQLLNIAHSQPDEHFYKVMFLSAENLTDEQKTKLKEKNILFSNYQDINLSLEQSKIALLYKLLHETSSLNFNDKIIFEYKDIDPVVIEILKSVYSAYPNLIPKNVQLNLRCLTDMDGVAIQGAGKIDFDYEQNLQTLLKNHLYVFNQLKPSEILGKIKEANINFFKPKCLTYPISPAELSEDNNAVLDYKQNGWFLAEPNELINGITWGDELSDFERNLFTLNKQGVLSALQNLVGEYKENDPVKLKNDFATQDIDEKVRKFYQENIKRSFFSDNDELNAIFSKYHCQTYSYFLNNFFTHAFEPLQGAVSHNDDIIANLSIVNKELFSEVRLPAVIFKDLVSQEGKDSFQLPGEVLALFSFSEKGIRLIGLKTSTSLLQDFIKGKNIDIKNKELRNQAAFQHLLYKLTKATNITDFTESKEEYIKHFGYVKYFPKFFNDVIKIYSVNNQEEKETTFELSEQVELAEQIIKDEPHNGYEDVCDAYKFLIVNLQAELAEAIVNFSKGSYEEKLDSLFLLINKLRSHVIAAQKFQFYETYEISQGLAELCKINKDLLSVVFNYLDKLPSFNGERKLELENIIKKISDVSICSENYLEDIIFLKTKNTFLKQLLLTPINTNVEELKPLFNKTFVNLSVLDQKTEDEVKLQLAKILKCHNVDDNDLVNFMSDNKNLLNQYVQAYQAFILESSDLLSLNIKQLNLFKSHYDLMESFAIWLKNKSGENLTANGFICISEKDLSQSVLESLTTRITNLGKNTLPLNITEENKHWLDTYGYKPQSGEYEKIDGFYKKDYERQRSDTVVEQSGQVFYGSEIDDPENFIKKLNCDENVKRYLTYLYYQSGLMSITTCCLQSNIFRNSIGSPYAFPVNSGRHFSIKILGDKKFEFTFLGRTNSPTGSNTEHELLYPYLGKIKLMVDCSDVESLQTEISINIIAFDFKEKMPPGLLVKENFSKLDFLSQPEIILSLAKFYQFNSENMDELKRKILENDFYYLSVLDLFYSAKLKNDKINYKVNLLFENFYKDNNFSEKAWIELANKLIVLGKNNTNSKNALDNAERMEELVNIGCKLINDVKKYKPLKDVIPLKNQKESTVQNFLQLLAYQFVEARQDDSKSKNLLNTFRSFINFAYLNKIQLETEWMAIFSVYEKYFHDYADRLGQDLVNKPIKDEIYKIFGASKEQKPGLYQALITTQLETGLVSLINALEYTHNLRPSMLGFAINLPAQNDNLVTLIKAMKQEDANKSKAQINFEKILATGANKIPEPQNYLEKHDNKHQYTVLRENILKNEHIKSKLSSLDIASLVKDDMTSTLAILKGSFWGWLFDNDIVDNLSSAALKAIILKQPHEEVLNAIFKPRKTFFGLINYLTVANNLTEADLFTVALNARIQPHLLSDSKQLNRLWHYIQQDESRIDNLFKEHFQLFNTLAETFRVNFASGPWTKYSELWLLFNSQVLNPAIELKAETINLLKILDKQQNLEQTTKFKLNEIDAAFKFRAVDGIDDESSEQDRDTNQSKSTIAIPHTPGGSRKPDVESKHAENTGTDKSEKVQGQNMQNTVQIPIFKI